MAATAIGKNIVLEAGESFSNDDLTVMCVGKRDSGQPLTIKECQHWDEFQEKCLFEKKIHFYGQLKCIEECQIWDSFTKKCLYRTSCRFHPDQESFVITTCKDFDSFNNICRQESQKKISSMPPR